VTIARSPRTDTSTDRLPANTEPTGKDSRPPRHLRRHDFLLLTQDLPGGNAPALQALLPVVAARRGGWIGRSPSTAPRSATYRDDVCVHDVGLTRAQPDDHVSRCEASIAGLYLDTAVRPSFDEAGAAAYRNLNERFADAAAGHAATGGVVLVLGHQLQFVPAMLRQRRPDLLIAYFLELPFPPGEMFRRMPLRNDLLEGLLGADLIGFQSARSAANFRRLAVHHADIRLGQDDLEIRGRSVGIGVFPQSVDTAAVRSLAARPGNLDQMKAVRAGLGDPRRIVLAIDDLDVAAGIVQRLTAYERLLDSGEVDPDHTTFVLFVRPDPARRACSDELRASVERRVGLINGRHGRSGRPALHYQHRAPDQAELVALYGAADVLWATPLQAGTSLSAKEYLAARADNSGAVVLGEFCGAIEELPDAYVANPYDIDDLRRVLLQVLRDGSADRQRRMAAMRRHVHTHDVHHWAGSLLAALGRSATAHVARTSAADVR
jgi:trehalose 6-phosphate synthase